MAVASKPVSASSKSRARAPLKVNIFDVMTRANTALMPLFPYLEPGCIVPTGNAFRGGPGNELSTFEHFNTVDEVSICFASHGCGLRPGMVVVGAKRHRVGDFFPDPQDPEAFVLTTVTQRQADAGVSQREAMIFTCANCQHPLVTRVYDAIPRVEAGIMPEGYELYVETVVEASQGVDALDDPAQRKCSECGHENAPFPGRNWGWRAYATQLALARQAWGQYAGLVGESTSDAATA